jgi:hypothetical protein
VPGDQQLERLAASLLHVADEILVVSVPGGNVGQRVG